MRRRSFIKGLATAAAAIMIPLQVARFGGDPSPLLPVWPETRTVVIDGHRFHRSSVCACCGKDFYPWVEWEDRLEVFGFAPGTVIRNSFLDYTAVCVKT